MSTLHELTDRIARMVYPEPGIETFRSVEKLILNHRALILRRDHERINLFHDRLVQTIPSIPVTEISAGEYDPSQGAYKTFFTELLPFAIRLKQGYAIRFVGTEDRSVKFHYVDPEALRLVKYSRYTHKEALYTFLGSRMFLFNIPDMPVRIEAVFEDPTRLFDFTDKDGNRVYDLDHEFPITEDLEQQIVQSILAAELRVLNPARPSEILTDPKQ